VSKGFTGVAVPGDGDGFRAALEENLGDCEGPSGPELEDDSGIWKLCRTRLRDMLDGALLTPKPMGGGVCNPVDDPGGVYCPVDGGVYLEYDE